MAERFYPKEENLGENCQFWTASEGCGFPKAQLIGRRSCEGVIDDVCLYVKDGREPLSLTQDQRREIKLRMPDFDQNILPPGETI